MKQGAAWRQRRARPPIDSILDVVLGERGVNGEAVTRLRALLHLAQHSIALREGRLLGHAMLCYAMLCHAYAMLCYAVLCRAMPCYAMLCYAMLCCGTHTR